MSDEKKLDFLGVTGLRKGPNHPDRKYASFNRRMIAATLDSIFALFTLAPLMDWVLKTVHPVKAQGVTLEQIQQLETETDPVKHAQLLHELTLQAAPQLAELLASSMLQAVAYIAVSMICWKLWSATPGKAIMRMKIVDATTETPISERQILLRGIGYIISGIPLCLGYFWIGFDKRRQGWHDKIANTVVINRPK